MLKIRKLVSLTAFLSFIGLVITSVILYFLPHGRIAYWNDWHLWGLSKDDWDALHINLGVLFLVAICFHIYLNWSALVNYLKNKARKLVIFTKEFGLALVLVIAFIVGTIAYVPPFSSIVNFSESLKNIVSKKYAEPPYGHAELSSLAVFCRKTGINLADALRRLKSEGVAVKNSKETIKEIAKANGMTPEEVYRKMLPKEPQQFNYLLETPRPGLGKMTLSEFCNGYHLSVDDVLDILSKSRIEARPEMTMKQIANENGMTPLDVYYVIKDGLK